PRSTGCSRGTTRSSSCASRPRRRGWSSRRSPASARSAGRPPRWRRRRGSRGRSRSAACARRSRRSRPSLCSGSVGSSAMADSAALHAPDERGQALVLLVAAMCAAMVAALVLGGIARGLGAAGRDQQAADLAALAGARAMRASYDRLFAPAFAGRTPNPQHIERSAYLATAHARALATAHLNGARRVAIAFPDGATFAPTRIRVTVEDPATVEVAGQQRSAAVRAVAEAQLSPGAAAAFAAGGP